MWGLLIKYRASVQTQIRCLSSCSGWLLLILLHLMMPRPSSSLRHLGWGLWMYMASHLNRVFIWEKLQRIALSPGLARRRAEFHCRLTQGNSWSQLTKWVSLTHASVQSTSTGRILSHGLGKV
jgi:hypothetical protein